MGVPGLAASGRSAFGLDMPACMAMLAVRNGSE